MDPAARTLEAFGLESCGPAALRPCGPAALRPCGPAALRPCGPAARARFRGAFWREKWRYLTTFLARSCGLPFGIGEIVERLEFSVWPPSSRSSLLTRQAGRISKRCSAPGVIRLAASASATRSARRSTDQYPLKSAHCGCAARPTAAIRTPTRPAVLSPTLMVSRWVGATSDREPITRACWACQFRGQGAPRTGTTAASGRSHVSLLELVVGVLARSRPGRGVG